MIEAGKITMINGPVLRGDNMSGFKMRIAFQRGLHKGQVVNQIIEALTM